MANPDWAEPKWRVFRPRGGRKTRQFAAKRPGPALTCLFFGLPCAPTPRPSAVPHQRRLVELAVRGPWQRLMQDDPLRHLVRFEALGAVTAQLLRVGRIGLGLDV